MVQLKFLSFKFIIHISHSFKEIIMIIKTYYIIIIDIDKAQFHLVGMFLVGTMDNLISYVRESTK